MLKRVLQGSRAKERDIFGNARKGTNLFEYMTIILFLGPLMFLGYASTLQAQNNEAGDSC